MAAFAGQVEVSLPQARVWTFVKDIDNWAHLFPGHQRHLEVETDHFFWQLRGEAGVWSRLVEFDVNVVEWAEPERVRFALKGRTEPVVGTGTCFTRSLSPTSSLLRFELDAHATGATAPMINLLLKKFVSEQSQPFLQALSNAMNALSAEAGGTAAPAPADEATAHGPGSIIVGYRAPRTTECERFLAEAYVNALWQEPSLIGYRRLERAASGGVGEYRDVVDTLELAAAVPHVRALLERIGPLAQERGISFEETYAMRRIARRRRPLPRQLAWRLRRKDGNGSLHRD